MKEEIVFKNLKILFDKVFQKEKSESLRDISREVYGEDYPEEANPDSYITITDLRTISNNLNVGPGKTFIDLGCGRGGPGLWIARETGANYVGIDIVESAIEEAKRRIKDYKIKGNFDFRVGNIHSLNFPAKSFDGAISIEVLHYMPDMLVAFKQVARILRSKSFFVFTAWENKKSPKIYDYRPYLRDAGFQVKTYIVTPDWKEHQREVYQKIIESKKVLIKDMGREGAFAWITDAKTFLPMLDDFRRILAVAIKI